MPLYQYLVPWELSPTLLALFALSALLFAGGSARVRVNAARKMLFWSGFALFYLSLQTRVDYYAEHQFFVHRLQHLVLHHLAPLLVMAAYPASVMRAALPLRWRVRLYRLRRTRMATVFMAVAMQPALVSILFIAAVLFWLIPSIQFISMLDWRLYRVMNWSVAITGLMYWALIVDRRRAPPARLKPGLRVISPIFTMTPQILAGAIITFTQHDLYPAFDLCGRVMTISALVDQSLGGLIMWVPAAMIEAAGGLVALRHWMRLSTKPMSRQAAVSQSTAYGAVHPAPQAGNHAAGQSGVQPVIQPLGTPPR